MCGMYVNGGGPARTGHLATGVCESVSLCTLTRPIEAGGVINVRQSVAARALFDTQSEYALEVSRLVREAVSFVIVSRLRCRVALRHKLQVVTLFGIILLYFD